MKIEKILALVLALVMVIGLFAGCGNNQNENNDSPKSTDAASTADGYDHQAIENAGEITITMMVSGTAYENDFETEILPRLIKEKWPNVTLEVTKLPDDNYYTSLKTKLASGECPDLILTQPMYAGQNSCYAMA